MTEALIPILILMFAADIILRAGLLLRKSDERNCYSFDVENRIEILTSKYDNLFKLVEEYNNIGYELAQIIPNLYVGDKYLTLAIFTRKKIRNCYED